MIVPSIAGGAVIEEEVGQSLPELSNEEIMRYSRHLIMPEVGMQGQRKLKAASVLMIGTGGLGAPVGMYWLPPASGASVSSTSTLSKNQTCSDRYSR
jgi:adenylyltransferase/sulfurtransferase